MFSLLSDIISYSIGSFFVGLVLTVLLVGMLFVLIRGFYPKRTFSPLSYIAAVILTVVLTFQIVPMCGAIALKWKCQDAKEWIDANLIHPEQYLLPREISSKESVEIAHKFIEEYPLFGAYADSGIFEGQTTETISQVMADTLNSYLTPFIWKTFGWSLACLIFMAVIVIFTMRINRNYGYSTIDIDNSFPTSGSYDDLTGPMF